MFILEMVDGHKLRREEQILKEYFDKRGYVEGKDWRKLSLRQLRRSTGIVSKTDYVAGSIDFVRAGIRQLGKDLPEDNCYPLSLRIQSDRFFKRPGPKITTLGSNTTWPIFLKPAVKTKLFTGQVFHDEDAFPLLRVNSNEKLWSSVVVDFVSEYRFYVVDGKINHSVQYTGPERIDLDWELVFEAVSILKDDGCLNYAVDFGITDQGKTAFIEMNDGFSLGCYGTFPGSNYSLLLQNRWKELTKE